MDSESFAKRCFVRRLVERNVWPDYIVSPGLLVESYRVVATPDGNAQPAWTGMALPPPLAGAGLVTGRSI